MSWSPREERAISHHLKHNNLRLELQPGFSRTVHLQEKATGKSVTVNLDSLLNTYDQDRAERAKERARARRAEQKARGAS